MYPLLDHEERMGVHLPDLLPQCLDLILGQADAKDLHLVPGIGPVAGPIGNARSIFRPSSQKGSSSRSFVTTSTWVVIFC